MRATYWYGEVMSGIKSLGMVGSYIILLTTTYTNLYLAALRLQTTTYPFVAFVGLQPRRTPASTSRSSPSPSLTVLSRHQGPSTPSTGPTSASTLSDHLQRQLLPRLIPFLERIRNSQRDRERERLLREEQDRAFQDSARRDREKIEAMIAAESLKAEENRRKEAEEREEAERIAREADEQEQREALRMEWRKWARRTLLLPDSATGLRMAIRLPGDKRVVRRFPPTATVTSLFTFVDVHLIPSHFETSDDPLFPPSGSASDEKAIENQIESEGTADAWWGFKLMLVYPRREIKWEAYTLLSDVESLKDGGQVVVEMIAGSRRTSTDRRRSSEAVQDGSDDGYSTEE
jgi:FAS-associated factor 2